jgi:DNA mismatch repair protein MutS
MMQQYLETKEQCKDCILFYRIGDFYEMFFEDAEIASRELELVLTGRDCGLENRAPMCGIPYHAYEGYVSKLIEKGYKVGICEQMEDPALAKGLVKREIIRVVTPGTVLESSMLDEKKNNYIGCACLQQEGFSLSVCDISTGEFLTTSSPEGPSRLLDELSKYAPSELLLCGIGKDSRLVKQINERFSLLIDFISYDPKDTLKQLRERFKGDIDKLTSQQAECASFLYKYISENQKSNLGHILKIKPYEVKDYLVLDSSARRNLELTETVRSKSRKGSLLWVLDHTETSMGSRLIRKWIEEPLIKYEAITKRQGAVQEFIDNVYVSSDIRAFLKNVYDIERLSSRISCGSANARDLVSLKQSLRELPDIKASLSSCKSPMLQEMYNDFDTLEDVYKLIDKAIDDSPSLTIKDGGIIKSGYNEEVDKLHDAMAHGKEWIATLEQQEREVTGIKSLKVGFNKVFGYYIEITKSNLSNVPEGRYIRKQTLTNGERFITEELKKEEDLILGAEQKIIDLEYNLFVEVRERIASQIFRIQKTAAYVASIDVLLSFASVSFEYNYVKPEMTTDGSIEIKNGRHPVVERVIQGVFVPNDTLIDKKDNTIAIITGPNMAGKSTYMRQVALICLIAQMGCFVPAETAKLSIIDRIFTRIGASDDLSLGQSTFMVEMSEVSHILENATPDSLIVLDEVGRGTSTFDGLSIAWSVVDYICRKIGAKTLFATHYHELTELEGKLRGVKNYCVSVKEHGDDIIFLRKIIRGGADQSYGIQVAKLAGLPDEVVTKARGILDRLEESDINKKNQLEEAAVTTSLEAKDTQKPKAQQLNMFNFKDEELVEALREIDIMNITPIDAMNTLYKLVKKAKGIQG